MRKRNMAEIYYCRNENDMKRVAIHILENGINDTSFEDDMNDADIYSCDYKPEDIECCEECELDECLLNKPRTLATLVVR